MVCFARVAALLSSVVLLLAASPGEPAPIKALDAWFKTWRAGKLDIEGRKAKEDLGNKSIARAHGLLPKGLVGALTARRELELLTDEAVKLNDAAAALRLLMVAAAGLDRATYTREMAPHVVRGIGEAAIIRLTSVEAKDAVLRMARAETPKDQKDAALAVRAAALRALGGFGEAAFRPTIEEQLHASHEHLRLAAVEGLLRLASPESTPQLARVVEVESQDLIVETAVAALQGILTTHRDKVAPEDQLLVVRNAIKALGRCSWRADVAIVGLLDQARSKESVPALIDVLERFTTRPEDVKTGKLSGLLRYRAYETLVAMTGALYPIDQPGQWREYWERERQNVEVVRKPSDDDQRKPGTVATGFFGVPVQGTRVMFVVDLSGSMDFSAPNGGTSDDGTRMRTRLDVAKEELARAVQGLPEISSFNMVTFNGDAKAKPWNKTLVPATAANKKRFLETVNGLDADGGTNTWAGMQEALQLKSLVYGSRYETNVDELFLLSDGMPSVGEVTDAREILRSIAETNRFAKVRINTVYIAGELTERDRDAVEAAGMSGVEFMKLLAEQHGGKAVKL